MMKWKIIKIYVINKDCCDIILIDIFHFCIYIGYCLCKFAKVLYYIVKRMFPLFM